MTTNPVKINIRRGAKEIGGSAVEIIAPSGERIVLDIGMPLDAPENRPDLLPDIRGLRKKTDDLLGIFISHAHMDHYGLGKWIDPEIPVYIGAAANRIIKAQDEYLKKAGIEISFAFANPVEIKKSTQYTVGPFTVTPYPVDHAAYESFAFLIEVGGKRIFYSGDFRKHGRTSYKTQDIIKNPPKNIDVLLMEGSSLQRLNPDQRFKSEAELETEFVSIFKDTPGLAMVHQSSQNIDRLVTVFRAAKKSGRTLVMVSYTGFILMSIGNDSLPNFTWSDVKKLTYKATRHHEITPTDIAAQPNKYVYLIGSGMLPELETAGLLTPDDAYIYSMWEGYREDFAKPVIKKMQDKNVSMYQIHTSGHADIPTLREFVSAIKPTRLVPIHTFYPEQFKELFSEYTTVELHPDNQEFEV